MICLLEVMIVSPRVVSGFTAVYRCPHVIKIKLFAVALEQSRPRSYHFHVFFAYLCGEKKNELGCMGVPIG